MPDGKQCLVGDVKLQGDLLKGAGFGHNVESKYGLKKGEAGCIPVSDFSNVLAYTQMFHSIQ
jgi:PIN domain nuclease of toxin-antitoxin system